MLYLPPNLNLGYVGFFCPKPYLISDPKSHLMLLFILDFQFSKYVLCAVCKLYYISWTVLQKRDNEGRESTARRNAFASFVFWIILHVALNRAFHRLKPSQYLISCTRRLSHSAIAHARRWALEKAHVVSPQEWRVSLHSHRQARAENENIFIWWK